MAALARVAELVDAHDSKSCSARSGGSIPSTGTSLRCFAATAGKPALQPLRSSKVFNEIRALLPYLGQARDDAAAALRRAVARAASLRRTRFRLLVLRRAPFPSRRKLDVVAEPL